MANLVAALGSPHSPFLPEKVRKEGPASQTGAYFEQLRARLAASRPDLLVVFTSDHLNKFFMDNMPTFCIGIEDQAEGPEHFVVMPHYTVKVHRGLATALLTQGLKKDFDLASAEEFQLDHSTLVPLHFVRPEMDLPIVPVFIRGLVPPLPRAGRCLALGRLVGDVLRAWPGSERVALLASGVFSLDVGSPRIGTVDHEWTAHVMDRLQRAEVDALAHEATTQRMLAAGSVAGEMLNWMALMGAMGNQARTAPITYAQLEEGHAYIHWDLEAA